MVPLASVGVAHVDLERIRLDRPRWPMLRPSCARASTAARVVCEGWGRSYGDAASTLAAQRST